jgi:hypothetical protein
MRASWDEAKALPRPHGTTHSKSAANGAPAPEAGAPKRSIPEITSEMVSAGYVALISEVPELTSALSPEDGAATVIAVYRAMSLARR